MHVAHSRKLILACIILFAACSTANNLFVSNADFEEGLANPYGTPPDYTPVIDPFFIADPTFAGSNCSGFPVPCGPYTIGNFDGGTVSSLPAWTVNSLAGFFAAIGYATPVFTSPPIGNYDAFAESGGTISQVTSDAVVQGVTYTLDVWVGYPANLGLGAPAPTVDLEIGSSIVGVGSTAGTLTVGGFVLYTATYTGTALTAGQDLTIAMGNTSGTAMFSDVSLSDSLPEPASWVLVGCGVLCLVVYRRRRTQIVE